MEMLERRPATPNQLLMITGVGQHKLDKYGDAFLAVLSEHGSKIAASSAFASDDDGIKVESYLETLALLKAGMDVPMIVKQRGIKSKTVYVHLEKCIQQGEIEIQDVIQLPEEDLNSIRDALFANADEENRIKLTPVFDDLAGAFSYEVLGCVRAELLRGL